MDFDIKRVYTAVNAEELKVGSKVIGADSLGDLEHAVKNDSPCRILEGLNSERTIYRFTCRNASGTDINWALAYLVEEPSSLKWTDLKMGDIARNKHTGVEYMVTAIDSKGNPHIHFADVLWVSDSSLEGYEKVEK